MKSCPTESSLCSGASSFMRVGMVKSHLFLDFVCDIFLYTVKPSAASYARAGLASLWLDCWLVLSHF